MKKIILAASFIFLISTSFCFAEGLDVLIQVAKSQADIKDQYQEETRNFNNIRKGIESGAIKKGQSKKDIQSKYGEPVVSIKNTDEKRENCIYKPEASSFFKGIRATLVYTEQGALDEITIEEIK